MLLQRCVTNFRTKSIHMLRMTVSIDMQSRNGIRRLKNTKDKYDIGKRKLGIQLLWLAKSQVL